jgi:hypothetical protein
MFQADFGGRTARDGDARGNGQFRTDRSRQRRRDACGAIIHCRRDGRHRATAASAGKSRH